MQGKHEPATKRSFYYSLATATLRGILVIAAVVLGVFVLSKAFPTGGEIPAAPEAAPGSPQPDQQPGASPTASPVPEQEPSPPVEGVVVEILNGTDVGGLAAETAEMLANRGYTTGEDLVGDAASKPEEQTTILFRRRPNRAAAEHLQETVFPTAVLESAPRHDENPDIQITVILGTDYAASLEEE